MQIEKNIAATLRYRMEAEKKSKLEFSKELGIPRSTFQGYLKGENCLRSDSIEEIAKGCFLLAKGMLSFTQFHHSVSEFLFSPVWKPTDTEVGGGQIGAAIYIWGSILTCAVALVIAIPFSLSTAIFMTQISPKIGEKIILLDRNGKGDCSKQPLSPSSVSVIAKSY